MKSFQYLAPIAPFDYVVPTDMTELLDILHDFGSDAKIISGGTDLTIALKQRLIKPKIIVDLNQIRGKLSGITIENDSLKIGATTTYTEIEKDQHINRHAQALSQAASQVGTFQIRNLGTIGANLANGSPAADSAPPLIALSAKIKLRSRQGERTIPIEEFFTGVKKTVLRPDEIITVIEIPIKNKTSSCWMRFAKRNENVISVVSVAAACEINQGTFGESRISLGAVAPTPILAKESSSKLTGKTISSETIDAAATAAKNECKPISDVRGSAEYRRHLVYVLSKRTISQAANGIRRQ